MNDILRWDQLYEPLRESMRQAQERFEHGTHFFTALVGVLEFGFGLDDYEEPRIEDRTIRFFTRPGDQNLGTFEPTANYPEYNYDYSFVLWKLRDDVDPPTDIEVTFKRQLKSTDSG